MADKASYQDILAALPGARKDVTGAVYDLKYEKKLKTRGEPRPKKRRLKRIALYQAIIGSGHERILEMGCGLGDLTYSLVDCAENIVGIDVSGKALDCAKERAGLWSLSEDRARKVRFLQMSAVQLDFPDKTFDWALSTSMIEHLAPDDIASHLAEVYRVLKSSGKYLIWCPNRLGHHKDREGHLSMLCYKEWMSKLGEAGFPRFRSTLTTRRPMVDARFKVFVEQALQLFQINTLWSHLGVRNVLLVAQK